MSGRMARSFAVLRISTTAIFSVFAVSFLVLWIRSYTYVEGGMISTLPNQHVGFHGGSGRMCVWFEHSAANTWFDWNTRPFQEGEKESVDPESRIPVFDLAFFWPTMTRLYVAHWLLVVVASCIALVPWCPRKFTIRGTLIALAVISAIIASVSWVDSNIP